ncbi:MAG TPA: prepilin-type N-terminal cleavage/methylation domain-containing protein [Gaiellaceae bacterium]|jgi:type IV pilus modification protein PilV
MRCEEGFTLVELLIAMVVLTIGILALIAAYSSGYTALNRATRVSSARLVADQQMERLRAVQYSAVMLNTTCGTSCTEDATFTGDPAYSSAAQVTGTTSPCSTTPPDSTCLPTQTKTGPDGKSYRLDTYIEYSCVSGTYASPTSCGSGNPYPVKRVTVVVRSSTLTAPVREQSTFTTFPGN